jgi:hypothetical protein
MSLRQKLIDLMTAHPKLATFAIGLAITMAVGTAIGMVDNQHLAFASGGTKSSSSGGGGG